MGESGDVVDCTLSSEPQVVPTSSWKNGMASWILERAVCVRSSEEAVHLYSRAQRACDEQSFVLALHVETLVDGRVRCGRFVCIDIHGRYTVAVVLNNELRAPS